MFCVPAFFFPARDLMRAEDCDVSRQGTHPCSPSVAGPAPTFSKKTGTAMKQTSAALVYGGGLPSEQSPEDR